MVVCATRTNPQDNGPCGVPCALRLETVVESGTLTITACGDLEYATAGVLRALVQDALTGDDVTAVVVDVAHLDFVDSSGLGSLLAARRDCQDEAVAFRLRHPRPALCDLLARMRLDQLFTI